MQEEEERAPNELLFSPFSNLVRRHKSVRHLGVGARTHLLRQQLKIIFLVNGQNPSSPSYSFYFIFSSIISDDLLPYFRMLSVWFKDRCQKIQASNDLHRSNSRKEKDMLKKAE
ncbi:hypothetical protein SLEP1_g18281 [Rubroshorea leprosula]|uniref:Uncharacterized protein n=1 Tax=Rubroshorea leprosula TaxID=152421 RepID=A0AAV5J662_9ROSI|nr:hypothetical protein SLEP1_g18281 [Rubroshorea leprosula]